MRRIIGGEPRRAVAEMSTAELRSEFEEIIADPDPAEGTPEYERYVEVATEYRARLRAQYRDGAPTETATFDRPGSTTTDDLLPHVGRARSAGLRTIERFRSAEVLSSDAADRLDAVIRRDRSGLDSHYLEAVADPAYNSAFGKMLADPLMGQLRMTREEVNAIQRVNAVTAERGLTLTGSAGGFAVPFQLDPTVVLTSAGAINPIREHARVIQISTDEWRGLSSAGVTAAYEAELAQVAEQSPVFAQPTASAEKGHSWVPFSIEIGDDWGTLQEELAKMLRDARDVLDATKFISGSGTNEPRGILTALTTAARVQTDVAATLDIDDVWDIKGQMGSTRFAGSLRWAANPGMFDRIYRMTPSGSTTEPQAMPTREGPLMGIDKFEPSTMANATTTGTKVAVLGDWSHYVIADRIGATIELVPHVFGANQRPTGQRGLYFYWRTGTALLAEAAFKYLEVL
jgi:HK97 family phage major capsid protein